MPATHTDAGEQLIDGMVNTYFWDWLANIVNLLLQQAAANYICYTH